MDLDLKTSNLVTIGGKKVKTRKSSVPGEGVMEVCTDQINTYIKQTLANQQ